ncbi:MAG: DUF4143 domain-containing protein [Proteobacteria bacterium]|nr:DUF4143 domain-containing protein [Pseudomonadota bacterium]
MAFNRLCKPLKSNSFFLFGARGVGKTTFLHNYLPSTRVWTIDLLINETEDRYARKPDQLFEQVAARAFELDWVVIDEIQKVPALLNVVHRIIETSEFKPPHFALTGSSARKLRRGSANLLAGRAFVYNLFPLTHIELAERFDLDTILNWGSLPKIFSLTDNDARAEYLRAYGLTYLKEEIWGEHLVEDLDPFRLFVEVAAQTNGAIVNFAKIAKDTGINEKTAKRYFEILDDTLLGFFLNAYSRSLRKKQSMSPKFYLFDVGVTRSLARFLNQTVVPKSQPYGVAFEQFIIAECVRLNEYGRHDFRFSYFRTKDGAEIDLVIERPGRSLVLVEIKSSTNTIDEDVTHLEKLREEFGEHDAYCFSNDPIPRLKGGIRYVHWRQGFQEIGLTLGSNEK